MMLIPLASYRVWAGLTHHTQQNEECKVWVGLTQSTQQNEEYKVWVGLTHYTQQTEIENAR